MERWISKDKKYGENSKIDYFLEDIIEVCKKHNLSLSHEDGHGNFEVTRFNESYAAWLLSASDRTEEQ